MSLLESQDLDRNWAAVSLKDHVSRMKNYQTRHLVMLASVVGACGFKSQPQIRCHLSPQFMCVFCTVMGVMLYRCTWTLTFNCCVVTFVVFILHIFVGPHIKVFLIEECWTSLWSSQFWFRSYKSKWAQPIWGLITLAHLIIQTVRKCARNCLAHD